MFWPDGGPWVVAPTSATGGWAVTTAALAVASSKRRVAVLRIVGGEPDRGAERDLLRASAATYVELVNRDGMLRVDEVVGMTHTLTRTHRLVLIGAVDGLLVPLGHGGWALADLAWALPAPVVVVAGAGPDLVNHTTLALDALASRNILASVVTVGVDDDVTGLPIRLAGRIPAGAAEDSQRFAAVAPTWLDPLLHGTRGVPAADDEPAVGDEPAADGKPASDDEPAAVTEPADNEPADNEPAADDKPASGHQATTAAQDGKTASNATASGDAAPDGGPKTTLTEPPGPTFRPVLLGSRARPPGTGRRAAAIVLAVVVASVLLVCAHNAMRTEAAYVQAELVPVQRPTRNGEVERRLEILTPESLSSGQPWQPPAHLVCPQYAGDAAREPDARTTARVNAAWKRLERWLSAHAPATRATLRPPASNGRIAALQARMSVPFPPDLVASLRRHDGAAGRAAFTFPPFYQPLGLAEIVVDWEVNCLVLASQPSLDDWWHADFVPFGSAGDGGSLLVDQRPGGHGRVGEFYPEEGTGFESWPSSVAELLEGVASALETGRPYAGQYRPTVTASGALEWEIERGR